MIRDLCVAYRGDWSANLIHDIALTLGVKGRRSDILSTIREVCGVSEKRGGKRVPVTGSHGVDLTGSRVVDVTGSATGSQGPLGTGSGTGSREKEKKQKKKSSRDTTPSGTTSPPAPSFDAETEADVAAFLLVVASSNTTGKISDGRAHGLRSEIARRISQYGLEAMCYGLREATLREKPVVGYAVACAKSYAEKHRTSTGSEGDDLTGSGPLFAEQREYAILDPLPDHVELAR